MIRNKKAALVIGIALAVIEIILGVQIQLKSSGITCYASVIIAVVCALLFTKADFRSLFVALGLVFTSFADVCLVLLNPIEQMLGMVFFTAAQICYAIGIYNIGKARVGVKTNVIPRGALALVLELAAFAVLGEAMDALVVITMLYFANLLCNTALLFFNGGSKTLAFGMLAFIGCDVFVGLHVLVQQYVTAAEGTLLYALTHTGINVAWLFYVPSQTLIALYVIAFAVRERNISSEHSSENRVQLDLNQSYIK